MPPARKLFAKIAFLLLFTLLLLSLLRGVRLQGDVTGLLPENGAGRALQVLKASGATNRVYVAVRGHDSEAVLKSARRLAGLMADSPLFSKVTGADAGSEFTGLLSLARRHLGVLLGPDDHRRLEERITPEGIRRHLSRALTMLGLPGSAWMKQYILSDPLGLTFIYLDKLKGLSPDSSLELRDGIVFNSQAGAALVMAEASSSLTDSTFARKVWGRLQEIMAEAQEEGVTFSPFGPLIHTLSNAETVKEDLARLLPLSMAALFLILFLFFPVLHGLVLAALPFLAAAPAMLVTAAAAGDGRVDPIALGFGMALTGIAVDFAIHLYGAYRADMEEGLSGESGLGRAVRAVRRPLIMAAATTFSVFATLFMSSVPIHRQMALFAMSGLASALLLSFWIVPDLARCRITGSWPFKKRPAPPLVSRLFLMRPSHPVGRWAVLAAWLILLFAGMASWSGLKYSSDLAQFDYMEQDRRMEEEQLRGLFGGSRFSTLLILKGDRWPELLDRNSRLAQMLRRKGARFLGADSVLPGPEVQRRNLRAWEEFWSSRLGRLEEDLTAQGGALGFSKEAFVPFLTWLKGPFDLLGAEDYRSFTRLSLISAYLGTTPAGCFATTCLRDEDAGLELLQEVERAFPDAAIISKAFWSTKMDACLKRELLRLFATALILISAVVVLSMGCRRPAGYLAVLAPLAAALCAIGIFARLSGGGLNPMHILMTIMVSGLSIDYGIFMSCRRGGGLGDTAARSVAICALTTLAAFGVLALARHPVLKSIGQTTCIGIGAALAAALLVSPLLARPERDADPFGGEER